MMTVLMYVCLIVITIVSAACATWCNYKCGPDSSTWSFVFGLLGVELSLFCGAVAMVVVMILFHRI